VQGVVACAGSRVNHSLYFGVPATWSPGGSPASHRPSGLVWSYEGFVRGTRRSLLCGKLHSEGGIELTRNSACALVV
jgi:hypothetical protein